jgi:hypothetical protein
MKKALAGRETGRRPCTDRHKGIPVALERKRKILFKIGVTFNHEKRNLYGWKTVITDEK